jgi:hypothetical protein
MLAHRVVQGLFLDTAGQKDSAIRELWRFLYDLFQASGSGTASGGPETVITVGASPFVYTASQRGAMLVSDGGLTNVEISRDAGITYRTTGSFRGMFPMTTNDLLRVTYQVSAPHMTFYPT